MCGASDLVKRSLRIVVIRQHANRQIEAQQSSLARSNVLHPCVIPVRSARRECESRIRWFLVGPIEGVSTIGETRRLWFADACCLLMWAILTIGCESQHQLDTGGSNAGNEDLVTNVGETPITLEPRAIRNDSVVGWSALDRQSASPDKLLSAGKKALLAHRLPIKTPEDWEAYLTACGDALSDARSALRSHVVIGSTLSGPPIRDAMRPVLRMLIVASQSAASHANWDESAECGLALVQLGVSVSTGGAVANHELGWVCIAFGVERLSESKPHLGAGAREQLVGELTELDAGLESFTRALERTDREENAAPMYGRYTKLELVARAEIRLCQLKLLAASYYDTHGMPPTSVEAVIGSHPTRISQDPISNRPFVFQPLPVKPWCQIYSVGFDGLDDGGNFIPDVNYKSTFPSQVDFTIP